MDNKKEIKCLSDIYKAILSTNSNFNLKFFKGLSDESMLNSVNKLVHFGWKKEAIPVTKTKKSILGRFFHTIFG